MSAYDNVTRVKLSQEKLHPLNQQHHIHKHHIQESQISKQHRWRILVSIGLLLPALAAIIGIVAWAISIEVAGPGPSSSSLSSSSSSLSNDDQIHRKLHHHNHHHHHNSHLHPHHQAQQSSQLLRQPPIEPQPLFRQFRHQQTREVEKVNLPVVVDSAASMPEQRQPVAALLSAGAPVQTARLAQPMNPEDSEAVDGERTVIGKPGSSSSIVAASAAARRRRKSRQQKKTESESIIGFLAANDDSEEDSQKDREKSSEEDASENDQGSSSILLTAKQEPVCSTGPACCSF